MQIIIIIWEYAVREEHIQEFSRACRADHCCKLGLRPHLPDIFFLSLGAVATAPYHVGVHCSNMLPIWCAR
jgi:hypothetical protein